MDFVNPFKIKKSKNQFKIKPIKINRPHFKLDTDRDNVFDFKDCRPFNPHLQHITPNKQMREELKKLPLYVEDYPGKKVHVTSKDAKKIAPKARQQLLSSIKKYPQMITDIKRISKYDPNYEYVHSTYQSPLSTATQLRTRAAYGTEFKQGDTVEVKREFGPLPVGEKAIITSIKGDEATIKVEGMEPHLINKDLLPQYFKKSHRTTSSIISEADRIKKMDEFIVKKEQEEKNLLLNLDDDSSLNNPFKTWSTPLGRIYREDQTSFERAKAIREHRRKRAEGLVLSREDKYFKRTVRPGNHTYRILSIMSDGKVHHFSDVMEQLVGRRSPESIGTNYTLRDISHSGLIKKVGRGKYKITSLGLKALEQANEIGTWSIYETVPERSGVPHPAKRVSKDTTKFNFLKLIKDHGRVRYKGFIGKRYDVGNMGASLTIRKLEEAGLVRRPKRGLYELTAKGKTALKQAEEEGTWINPTISKYEPTINNIINDIGNKVINIRYLGQHIATRKSTVDNAIIFKPHTQDEKFIIELYINTGIPNRPYRLVIRDKVDMEKIVSYGITEPERNIQTTAEFLDYIFDHIEYSDIIGGI